MEIKYIMCKTPKMRIPKKEWERIWKTIRCNCGHYSKDHYLGEGFCDLCGCTWYWPNDKYLLKYQKKLAEIKS